jgi:tRNA G10  N-methylase Trm11
MQNQGQKYAFILGREREIALEELKATLGRFGFCFGVLSITGNTAIINIEKTGECDVASLAEVLGGTIKIFDVADHLASDPVRQIIDLIETRKSGQTGKIDFGISSYNKRFTRNKINTIGLEVKRGLKGTLSTRFVALRQEDELSSIVSLKNNLAGKGIEIGIFDGDLGILVGLSNPEEWSERDYGKPASDKYSGMVPHKLARMLVNLVLGQVMTNVKFQMPNKNPNVKIQKESILFKSDGGKFDIRNSDFGFNGCQATVTDPFCGSGNILMEAMMLGCDVVGSDKSEKAVSDTKKNLEWLSENLSFNNSHLPFNDSLDHLGNEQMGNNQINAKCKMKNEKFTVFQADATSAQLIENWKLEIENYDRIVIVTELYLGEPKKFKSSPSAVRGEYAKVRELYLGFLSNMRNLGWKGVLCVIFPLVETFDGGQFSLYQNSVDEIKRLGYTDTRPPLIYGRDYQIVKREIVFLKLEARNPKS